MSLWARLRAWWWRGYVSPEVLRAHALQATKAGWEGPRWRTPKELAKREEQ